jgi:putative DNA primase/helicase
LPGLLPHHLQELRRSGLKDETIRAAGIYSEANITKLDVMLNRKPGYTRRYHLAPAIVFPFTAQDGRSGYCRAKPDHPRRGTEGKSIKYESPKDHPNEVYLPPGVAAVLKNPTQELLLTEGEKKALAATQEGFPCLGLVGVYGWKEKNCESLLPSLETIAWQGREVRIVFDSDVAEKAPVQDAEARLAAQLANRGARVRVVRLPHGPAVEDGTPAKMGLDDFIVAHGVGELRRLLDNAEEPRQLSGAEVKFDARSLDAAEAAGRFLSGTIVDGLPRLRFWRGGFYYWQYGAYREVNEKEVRAELIKFLNQSWRRLTISAVNNVMDQLKAQIILSFKINPPIWLGSEPEQWASHEVLVCKNGLIHLPTLVSGCADCRRPPTPTFFATAGLDYDFDPRPPRPANWLDFLQQLWSDDPQSIAALQKWFGYLLTQDTRQQKILLLVGPKRSGKGTIARVLRGMIGEQNVCGPSLASLSSNFGLSPLLGKSLAVVSDARLSSRTDSAIVVERLLSISGEDAVTVDRKYLEPITCKLPTRLMILTNELPRLSDTSGALIDRFVVLRLTRSFSGQEDRDLSDKLRAELPGILHWGIQGWQRLREQGRFEQPESAEEVVNHLADLTSPITRFVHDYCMLGPTHHVLIDELYGLWQEWCEANGYEKAGPKQVFCRELLAAVPNLLQHQPRQGDRRVRVYEGIGLRDQG